MGYESVTSNAGARSGFGVVRLSVSVLFLLSALVWSSCQAAPDSCLKLVFGRYCLGADVGPLLQAQPQPLTRLTEGNSLAVVFPDEVDQIYVMAYRGRIYKVVRAYRVATQLRYDDLYGLLKDKYGPGEDQSRFPEYASTSGRRLAAIRRGEGRAVHVWKPSDAWHIELTWTRELGLALAYVADALDAQRAAELSGGL